MLRVHPLLAHHRSPITPPACLGAPALQPEAKIKQGKGGRRGLGFIINILIWGLPPKHTKAWGGGDLRVG